MRENYLYVNSIFSVVLCSEECIKLKLPATSCRESPTVKENFIFYSLANPAASNGECARCSVHAMSLLLVLFPSIRLDDPFLYFFDLTLFFFVKGLRLNGTLHDMGGYKYEEVPLFA